MSVRRRLVLNFPQRATGRSREGDVLGLRVLSKLGTRLAETHLPPTPSPTNEV